MANMSQNGCLLLLQLVMLRRRLFTSTLSQGLSSLSFGAVCLQNCLRGLVAGSSLQCCSLCRQAFYEQATPIVPLP